MWRECHARYTYKYESLYILQKELQIINAFRIQTVQMHEQTPHLHLRMPRMWRECHARYTYKYESLYSTERVATYKRFPHSARL